MAFYIKESKLERGTLIRFERDVYGSDWHVVKAGLIGMIIEHPQPAIMEVLIGDKLVSLRFSHVSITGWISDITVIK